MAKLTALQPINHDGKDYAEGDTFSVSNPAQVAQLVDAGSAVVEGTKTKAAKTAEAEAAAAQAALEADAAAAAEAAARQSAESAAQAAGDAPQA